MQKKSKPEIFIAGMLSALALNQGIALPVYRSVRIKVYSQPKSINQLCWEKTGQQIRQAINEYRRNTLAAR